MQNKFVALRQFDGSVKLLKIDLATGERQIVPSAKVNQKHVTLGAFEVEKVEPELESVALLATPEGPLLILKDLQFRPDIQNTRIEVKDDGKFSHFLVLDDGEPVFGLFYEEKFGIGLHPYLHERQDFDFYYWLSKNLNDPKLYRYYTKEIKYIDSQQSGT
jgi:hypothetical protein